MAWAVHMTRVETSSPELEEFLWATGLTWREITVSGGMQQGRCMQCIAWFVMEGYFEGCQPCMLPWMCWAAAAGGGCDM